jgi:hypothetical protein
MTVVFVIADIDVIARHRPGSEEQNRKSHHGGTEKTKSRDWLKRLKVNSYFKKP